MTLALNAKMTIPDSQPLETPGHFKYPADFEPAIEQAVHAVQKKTI